MRCAPLRRHAVPESAWDFSRLRAFMTWNLMHVAQMIRDRGGVPAYGNLRYGRDAGCRFDFDNPEYR